MNINWYYYWLVLTKIMIIEHFKHAGYSVDIYCYYYDGYH